ncbi:MAG: STT3 domain-containing protein [Halobacteria archaeon]|nr:STT3 domain-containing protein [Halobacteria archaeon]
MDEMREEVEDLLDEKPDIEDSLRQLIEIDSSNESWDFDDTPFDSGEFGELVSRGILDKDEEGGYEISDTKSVRTAVEGQSDDSDNESYEYELSLPDLPSFNPVSSAYLIGSLLIVVAFRSITYSDVFRGSDVVLAVNDPYYYRYWVDRLLEKTSGGLLDAILKVPSGIQQGEPLMVAVLGWLSGILGTDIVLPWFPVVSAVITGLLVYLVSVRLTKDKRAGIASVVALGVIPAHAFRTSLGFADHHPFDYPWLGLTVLSLVMLADTDKTTIYRYRSIGLSALLGISISGQVLSWDNSPILIAPLGLYIFFVVFSYMRSQVSPLRRNIPVILGLSMASVVSYLFHTRLGWHTDIVAYSPFLLLLGVAAVVVAAETAYRLEVSLRQLAAVEAVLAVIGATAFRFILPDFYSRLISELNNFVGLGGIAETQSLLQGGGVLGPITNFGLFLFLGLGYIVFSVWWSYSRNEPKWTVLGVYGVYFFILGVVQVRFAGQLSFFIAVFTGVGILHLASLVDLTSQPAFLDSDGADNRRSVKEIQIPDRRTAAYVIALFLLVGGINIPQTALHVQKGTVVSDSEYDAVKWLESYSKKNDLSYPDNYVFSEWGENRAYNYFVNGESKSYGYAKSNFRDFLTSDSPEEWYSRLNSQHDGFVFLKKIDSQDVPVESVYSRLYNSYGSRRLGVPGVSHYRAVYAKNSIRIFEVVPGAKLRGSVSPNSNLTIKSTVDIEDQTFVYNRQATANSEGNFSLTVPYSGEYSIGNQTVEVTDSDVRNGNVIDI